MPDPPKCKTCKEQPDVGQGQRVVSPQGVEHIHGFYGMTLCGKNATGPAWRWPE